VDRLLLTVREIRALLAATSARTKAHNPKRPYPIGSDEWRRAVPSLSSWSEAAGPDEKILIERGRPLRFDPGRLPPQEEIPGVNFLRSRSDVAEDIVMEVYRDVTVAFSPMGFAVWRGNALFPCSSAIPDFDARRVPTDERRRVPSGFYAGDQFRTKSICHYTFDYVARAFFASSLFGLAADELLFPPAVNDYQRTIKEATFPSAAEVQFDTLYEFDTFYLSADSSAGLNHPAHHCDRRVMGFLRERVLKRLPKTGQAKRAGKLYLSRQDARNRRPLLNEEEVETALRKLGYTILQMSTLPPATQISLVNEARFVVAPHGAALTSIAFAEAPATLIEIMNPNRGTLAYFKLAQSCDLFYRMLVAECPSDPRAMSIPLEKLTAAILDAEAGH